jgi:hypothetical protein
MGGTGFEEEEARFVDGKMWRGFGPSGFGRIAQDSKKSANPRPWTKMDKERQINMYIVVSDGDGIREFERSNLLNLSNYKSVKNKK